MQNLLDTDPGKFATAMNKFLVGDMPFDSVVEGLHDVNAASEEAAFTINGNRNALIEEDRQNQIKIKRLEELIESLGTYQGTFKEFMEQQDASTILFNKTELGQQRLIQAQIEGVKQNRSSFKSTEEYHAVLKMLQSQLKM